MAGLYLFKTLEEEGLCFAAVGERYWPPPCA